MFRPVHLYVHVPFCARRCSYCDFSIAVRPRVPSSEFAELIRAEWRRWLDAPWWSEAGAIETIYFGGGTPSQIEPDAITSIVEAIRRDRPVADDAELTIEANPEDITPARAEAWVKTGINRVSLGVQSFDPAVLAWMHRVHDADRPAEAVGALRAAGLGNISVDLIYAVPDALNRDWARDIDLAIALDPNHLSLYGLTVEAQTPLARWVERGSSVPAPDTRAESEYLAASERLASAGFRHYEVSNAARPGFESRHNRAYWRRAPYLGLGPSAHSAVGHHRWWNLRDWEAYRRAGSEGDELVAGNEHLTPDQVRLEDLYLGLRTDSGIPASSLPLMELEAWETAGWAGRVGSSLVLTPLGWLRLDALVSRVARS